MSCLGSGAGAGPGAGFESRKSGACRPLGARSGKCLRPWRIHRLSCLSFDMTLVEARAGGWPDKAAWIEQFSEVRKLDRPVDEVEVRTLEFQVIERFEEPVAPTLQAVPGGPRAAQVPSRSRTSLMVSSMSARARSASGRRAISSSAGTSLSSRHSSNCVRAAMCAGRVWKW